MQPIWNHISNQKLVANNILDIVTTTSSLRISFAAPDIRKPDFRIYLFVAVLLVAIGGVLIGLKIGGVNGLIAEGSTSLGLIVCLALLFVKRKNGAIVEVPKKYSPEKIGQLLYYSSYPIIINNLGLEAIRLIAQELFRSKRSEELIGDILRTTNSEIAGNPYDGNNWKGSKAQTICRDALGIDSQERPNNIVRRFLILQNLPNTTAYNIYQDCLNYPEEMQIIVDRVTLPQLLYLIRHFCGSPDWKGHKINEKERRFFQAIYYTTNPNIEGNTFAEHLAKQAQLLWLTMLPVPLNAMILTYKELGEIEPGTKVAKIANELQHPTSHPEVFEYFEDRLRAAFIKSQ